MIIDSSALIAIAAQGSHRRGRLLAVINAADSLAISAATYRRSIHCRRRHAEIPSRSADSMQCSRNCDLEVVPFTEDQARIARQAYRDYGRGSGHRANLNFGDCFSYALAAERREPLLYVGDDFGHTDIRSALES